MQHAIAIALISLAVAATLAGLAWEAGLQDLVRQARRKRRITVNAYKVPARRQP